MTGIVASLDALYLLRDVAPSPELDPVAAVKLAELAGAEAIRVSGERAEADLDALRRVARCLEVTIESSPGGVKTALEFRPDRAILTEEATAPVLRQLEEAGIEVWARVAPSVEAVKAAHTVGVAGVEIDTSQAVDLPGKALIQALEGVGDGSRLAAKLHLPVSLGGGLDTRTLRLFAERAPALARVTIGRSLVARALLVGVERALRDLDARLP